MKDKDQVTESSLHSTAAPWGAKENRAETILKVTTAMSRKVENRLYGFKKANAFQTG